MGQEIIHETMRPVYVVGERCYLTLPSARRAAARRLVYAAWSDPYEINHKEACAGTGAYVDPAHWELAARRVAAHLRANGDVPDLAEVERILEAADRELGCPQ